MNYSVKTIDGLPTETATEYFFYRLSPFFYSNSMLILC